MRELSAMGQLSTPTQPSISLGSVSVIVWITGVETLNDKLWLQAKVRVHGLGCMTALSVTYSATVAAVCGLWSYISALSLPFYPRGDAIGFLLFTVFGSSSSRKNERGDVADLFGLLRVIEEASLSASGHWSSALPHFHPNIARNLHSLTQFPCNSIPSPSLTDVLTASK